MDTSTLPGRGIKPWLSLRKHYRVSIVIWLLVVLAGLPVVWIKGKSYYYTESVFQVSPTFIKTLSSDSEVQFQSNSQYREYVNQLSNSVRRYDVIERAMKKLREAHIDLPSKGLSERKLIEQMQMQLLVRAIPDTYMVRIGLQGPDKDKLEPIVNAVTETFLETTKVEQIYGSAERVDALKTNQERLRKEIAELETQRLKFAATLGLTTFTESVSNPFDGMLVQAREKYTTASIDHVQAVAALQAFLKQRETPAAAGRSLLEMRQQDSALQLLRTEVIKRSEELTRTIAGLEDKHPAKRPALLELDVITKRLQARESGVDNSNFENVRKRLEASVLQTRQVESEVQLKMKAIENQAVTYARNFQSAMRITTEIHRRELDDKAVRERLDYLGSESRALGFVRLVTPALPAITPMGLGKTKLLLIVLLLASALALAAPVMLDMLDRRLYTVNDAEKLLDIPAAGWQMAVTDLPSQLYAREQTRRFASTLMRDKSRTGQSVFAFAAIKSGDRAMTVILDTAVELHQLGLRVLVVDANSFLPSAVFHPGHSGLTDYLADEAAVAQVIQKVAYHDAAVDGVGYGRQKNFGIQRLDRLKLAIDHWRAEYDFILVDLPPLLLSADAELLIGALGQVFMVLEAQAVSKGEVSRAKRMLEKLDPDAMGLFVDNIPFFRGSGYMEQVVLETIGKTSMDTFMSLSSLKLQLELLSMRWVQWRMKRSPHSGKSKVDQDASKH